MAAYLRVNRRTVTALIRPGKLAAHKVGAQWRILRADLEEFMAQREVETWDIHRDPLTGALQNITVHRAGEPFEERLAGVRRRMIRGFHVCGWI